MCPGKVAANSSGTAKAPLGSSGAPLIGGELKERKKELSGRIKKASPRAPSCAYNLSLSTSPLIVEVPDGYLGVLKSAEAFRGTQCAEEISTKVYVEYYRSKGSFRLASELRKLLLLNEKLIVKSRNNTPLDLAVLWGDLLPKGIGAQGSEEASMLSSIAKLVRSAASLANETGTPLIGISDESSCDLPLLLGLGDVNTSDRVLATLLLEEGEYLVLSYRTIVDGLLEAWDRGEYQSLTYLGKLQRRFQLIEALLTRYGDVLDSTYIIYYMPRPKSLAIRAELYLPLSLTPELAANYLAEIADGGRAAKLYELVRLSSTISREEALNAYRAALEKLSKEKPAIADIYTLIMRELEKS